MRRAVSVIACCAGLFTATPLSPALADDSPAVASVEDVRAISGVEEFYAPPGDDRAAPLSDPGAPVACHAVYDSAVVFGNEWTRFRGVVYSAWLAHPVIPELATVSQEIAIYPNSVVAQGLLTAVREAAPGCAAVGTGFHDKSVAQPYPATILVDGDVSACAYRVAGAALTRVCAQVPEDDAGIAIDITDALAGANGY